MAFAAIALSIAAGVVSASNTLAAGKAEERAADARALALDTEAGQARQFAGQERAAGQRAASERRREGELLSSRALAVSAASGAGAANPTVENIVGDIGAEGEFRALTEMFEAEERAREFETVGLFRAFEARQERRAGKVARKSSKNAAFAQLLGGGANAASFGGGTTGGGGRGLTRFGSGSGTGQGPFAGRPR